MGVTCVILNDCGWGLKLWEEPITMGRTKSCCEWNMQIIVGGAQSYCGWVLVLRVEFLIAVLVFMRRSQLWVTCVTKLLWA